MSKKIFTVAILGCGGRGAETYGRLIAERKDEYKIVALCDLIPEKLSKYGELFGVGAENRFSDDDSFFAKKRADLLIIATLDADHVWQCKEALRLGYDVLLEKPITDKEEECRSLLAAQKKYGGKVLVCHVLRYAGAFRKVEELLKAGAVGRLVEIQALEQVAYWHQAHSYVRGNWRRSEDTSPMILAKCCHDLDLLQYYAGARCKSVSSMGDLTYFTSKNAPEGAAKRCLECQYIDTCPYSAKTIYIDEWEKKGCPENEWPYNVVTLAFPQTKKALTEAIETGPYGRCVFACDNDVVDHQQVSMAFENGVKATLTMTAFTAGGRQNHAIFRHDGRNRTRRSAGYNRGQTFWKADANAPYRRSYRKRLWPRRRRQRTHREAVRSPFGGTASGYVFGSVCRESSYGNCS